MFMNYELYFSMNLFMLACFLFSMNFKHILMLLIVLEFIMIYTFMGLFSMLVFLNNSEFLVMIFLIVSVCEGALGLTLIVTVVRFYGNDFMKSMYLKSW